MQAKFSISHEKNKRREQVYKRTHVEETVIVSGEINRILRNKNL